MKTYQNFSFQDRAAQGARAKQQKLDMLRAKLPIDPAVQEARLIASQRREAAEVEKRLYRKAAERDAKQAASEGKIASRQAEAARLAAIKPEPTEDERKLARDAKYAARKSRR